MKSFSVMICVYLSREEGWTVAQIYIFRVNFVIVLMCLYVMIDYQKDKINRFQFIIWVAVVFMTGHIGFFLYLFKVREDLKL